MSIIIVGLGPGDGRYLTRQAWETLTSAEEIYLRTGRHPAIADLPAHIRQITFDAIYESAENFAEVYSRIVTELIQQTKEAAGQGKDVLYAVPGSPFVGESTVTALLAAAEQEKLPVTIIPGLSFIEPALQAIGLDALDGLQLFDAIEIAAFSHPPLSPDTPLLLGQVYNKLVAGELKLALTALYPEEHEVTLIHAAATPQQFTEQLPLYQLDHSDHLAHVTSLSVPALPYSGSLPSLAETVAYLRGPDGCPWDREQTAQSLRADFIEEVAESLGAIEADDPAALCEELGDVLFHLVIQAQIAAETGDFTLTDVIAGVDAKLRRRHPHVWGDWQASETHEVIHHWEAIKAQEKGPVDEPLSVLDNLPMELPALARAQKIQKRVKKVGFDWPDSEGVLAKVSEELAELKAAENSLEQSAELGDLLFAVVNWARWLDVDAEIALREANLRFEQRFREMETLAQARGLSLAGLDLQALDSLWEEAKEIVWRRF
jgi:tetrapyrrole methylase family protein/MazG family protein